MGPDNAIPRYRSVCTERAKVQRFRNDSSGAGLLMGLPIQGLLRILLRMKCGLLILHPLNQFLDPIK
jgi:hypothetical protein